MIQITKNLLWFIQTLNWRDIFTIDDVIKYSKTDYHWIIKELSERKIIKRIKRWYYLLQQMSDIGKDYVSIDPKRLISAINGNPVLAYWTAFQYYDLSDQFYTKMIVSVDKQPRETNISLAGVPFYLVFENKNFWITRVMLEGGIYVKITDVHRTLLDCISKPDLCIDIKEVVKWYYNLYQRKELDFSILNKYIPFYKNKNRIIKTLGYFSDLYWIKVPNNIMKSWQKEIKKSWTHLEPLTIWTQDLIYDKKWYLVLSPEENFKSLIEN